MKQRRILVTSALPYANGPAHLGHMVEHIQTDLWARSQKMLGHDVISVCGDDAHGTPIMLKAESLGISPEQLIAEVKASHEQDFADFAIGYDCYHTTHSDENRELAAAIYQTLEARGDIAKRVISQAFDPEKNMFLPDRFVKGECPRCGAADQYGDNCEACGATYAPTDLKNPVSVLTGATPIQKDSLHFFFDLPKYKDMLAEWIHAGHVQSEIAHKLDEWFAAGLAQWDISRDAPYFGFPIPGTTDKFFYVWMDAPIGYIASFKKLCNERGLNFDEYWGADSKVELHHFIGKDIVYFHALFWPAVLHGAGYRTPTAIHAHGFLTVDGKKMSKSRGTFIRARTYLNHLPMEYLRYYFAAKLSSRIDDIDLNFQDFVNRINADLVGKFVNIASRCAGFIHKHFDGVLSSELADAELYQRFVAAGDDIAARYDSADTARAVRDIMELADRANQYIDEKKPWAMVKQDGPTADVQNVCSMGLNLFRCLMVYLKPILPVTAEKVEAFFNDSALTWQSRTQPLLAHKIAEFQPLMQRISLDEVNAMIEEEKAASAPAAPVAKADPMADTINIDDFAKCDLRIAKIIEADHVEGADKLLRLRVDLGDEQRQIFAGIKSAYQPEALIGRYTLVIANLAPRKMRFGLSEGMVLVASGGNGKDLFLLSPDAGAVAGMRVK